MGCYAATRSTVDLVKVDGMLRRRLRMLSGGRLQLDHGRRLHQEGQG